MLGAIIEAASGLSYSEYLKKNLFGLAELHRTVYGDAEDLPDRAQGYGVLDEETIVLARPIHMSVAFSNGGIRSTANDLVKWDSALRNGKLLNESSLADSIARKKRTTRMAGKWIIDLGFG